MAPIIATEGGVGGLFAVVLGDPLGIASALLLGAHRPSGSSCPRSSRRARPFAGDIELFADALDGPVRGRAAGSPTRTRTTSASR